MADSPYLPYAYFEGEIRPFEDSKVSIATHALQYGTGAFAGLRGYLSADGESINVFRLPDHTARMMNSGRMLRADLAVDAVSLADTIVELIDRNNPGANIYIRPFIYKAGLDLSPRLKGIKDEIAIYMLKLDDYFDLASPLKFMVSSWVRVADNILPSRSKITGGYINSSLAKDQAEEGGYDDAIMLNVHGKVAEASAANLFIVRNGNLITSPISADILEGITRRSVLSFASDAGIPIQVREIDRSELYIADEVLVCGTGAQIASVGSIDGRPVGNGERGRITKTIQDVYYACVRGEDRKYDHWVTKVPVRPSS